MSVWPWVALLPTQRAPCTESPGAKDGAGYPRVSRSLETQEGLSRSAPRSRMVLSEQWWLILNGEGRKWSLAGLDS